MSRALPAVRSTARKPTIVGPPAPYFRYPVNSSGYDALLVSDGHPYFNGRWFGGGPFYVFKTSIEHMDPLTLYRYTWGYQDLAPHTWLGVNVPYGTYNPWTGVAVQSIPTFNNWWSPEDRTFAYTRGYGRARPGRPKATLGVSIGEFLNGDRLKIPGLTSRNRAMRAVLQDRRQPLRRLAQGFRGVRFRDIVPNLLGRLGVLRAAGDEYLNIVFGWKPFLRDLRDTYSAMQELRYQLDKLLAESGRILRRRATVKHEVSVTQPINATYAYPFAQVNGGVGGWPMIGSSTHTVTRRVEERVWFVGHWIYYLYHLNDWLWEASATSALFGTNVTPELLWNLLPWSWLVDWFGNVGDILANASPNAAGSPLLLDSYLMRSLTDECEAECRVTLDANDHPGYNWPRVSHTFRTRLRVASKQRQVGGNPFGFAQDRTLEDLNVHQFQILAALGLSKGQNF
jgi:hypothetical protein